MPTQTLPGTQTSSPDPAADAAAGVQDEFVQLEAKIQRVAEALQTARGERDRALAELESLRGAHAKLQQAQTGAERELVSLRKERNEIRQRVNRLVSQLESSLT